jgi:hypothetical protein
MISQQLADLSKIYGLIAKVLKILHLHVLSSTHSIFIEQELENLGVLGEQDPHTVSISVLFIIV